MKKTLCAAILFFVLSVLHAQNLSSEEKAINETLTALFDALARKDTATLKYHCTKDVIILEDKEIWNLDTLISLVGPNTDTSFKRVNRIDFIETKVRGKTGWTCYHNQANISRRGRQITVKWLETAIFVKEDRRWKMRVLHSTLVERK
jgi:ketosteroid isomerase-like protein